MPIRARTALALIATALALPSSAAADVVLASEPAAPKVSASGGAVAWSTFDTAAGVWRLVIRIGGTDARAAVPPRAVPFDVDLGRGADGRLVAVYSRCDREPRVFATTGRGCDLYVYDVATGRERRVAGASTPGASEFLPSLAGRRIAFARVYERRRGSAGVRSHMYVRRLARGPAVRMRGGTVNHDDRTGPTAIDFDGRRIAFAWDVHGPAGQDAGYGLGELWVAELGGGRTLVERYINGNLSVVSMLAPTLLDGVLHYGTTFAGEAERIGNELRTYDLAHGDRRSATVPYRLAGAAADRGAVYSVVCSGEPERCELALREGLVFAEVDRELARAERPTTASGFRGTVAFSAYDEAVGGYRLMIRSSGGAVSALPVLVRPVPFDVDLGPGPGGRMMAVYSRCATEPRLDDEGLPLPASGRGCDVYSYDFRTGREARVRVASRDGTSEFLPAIWGGDIAFARRDGARTSLFVGRLRGDRVAGRPAGPRSVDPGFGPRGVDLFGRRLVVVWEHQRRSGRLHSEVLLHAGSGPWQRMAATDSRSGTRRFLSPGFDRRMVSWVSRRPGRSLALRVDRITGARTTLVLPDPATAFVAATALTRTGVTAYGRVEPGGWSLREVTWLPESVR